jgi:hypothetical protein
MATIVVGTGNILRPYRKCEIRNFPEDASQTFKKGEILILSSTGGKEDKVKIAGADPTAKMVGVAGADASGVEGTLIPVYLFTDRSEFLIHMGDTQTVARTDLNVSYGVVRDSTNVIWRLDNTETTAKVFEVVGLIDAHGDVNGRVVVRPTTATHKLAFGVN